MQGVSLGWPRDAACAPPAALAFALSSLLCHHSHSQSMKSTPLQQACAETCMPLQKPDLFSSTCVCWRFLSSHYTNNYAYWEQVVGGKGQWKPPTQQMCWGSFWVARWAHLSTQQGLGFRLVLPHPSSSSHVSPNPAVPSSVVLCPPPTHLLSPGTAAPSSALPSQAAEPDLN